jgi:hypothetical protein
MGCCRVDYVGITSVELAPGILWHRDELEVLNFPNVEACLVRGEALGLMDMSVCLLAPSLQLLAEEKGLHTAKKIPFMYSFSGLCGLSPHCHIHLSVSNSYIHRIGPHIFLRQNRRSMVGIYKSLTDK